ncbi:outer membrane beta-barrel protein [Aquimarina spongiae]|uniref:Outer membrane insertion C-terminal signal n=1 Tax=Aquimarina spongiae TaxID=570521 RepID=A0A1M6LC27_9FLAO|nr:outer membrane beta-barrel protein [Aquimarina spongiae]SHJ68746.1 outer membrane insertion C-terminal signal [Aquimarina spongiae]
MKKVFLVLFLMGALTTMNAQEVVFGVKAGVNFSKFGKDADADGRTSLFIGGLADFTINEQFHIQPELLYSSEGSEDIEANFIRVLGIGKYYPVEGFSLEAGPQFGIRVSADNAIEDTTKSFDFGLSFGAGYELTDIGLLFNLRYNAGIANLSDVDGFDTNLGTFQLGVGYKFY